MITSALLVSLREKLEAITLNGPILLSIMASSFEDSMNSPSISLTAILFSSNIEIIKTASFSIKSSSLFINSKTIGLCL